MSITIASVCLWISSALPATTFDEPSGVLPRRASEAKDEPRAPHAAGPRRVLDLSVGRRAALARSQDPIGPALPLRLEAYEAAPASPPTAPELPEPPRNLSLRAAAPDPVHPYALDELDLGREMRRWRLSRPGWQVYYGPCSGAPIPTRCLR